MARKDSICPSCGTSGKVNSSLKCESCGEQLEYADANGALRIAEKERRCPRCNTQNAKDVRYCESCGAQVGKYCRYCKQYHFIEDKVCPKTSEPIKGGAQDGNKSPIFSKVLTVASIIAILFFGFMMMNSKKPNKTKPGNGPTVVTSPGDNGNNNNGGLFQGKPKIDVVFVVDATGSMGDEIDAVKSKIRTMVRTIAAGQPKPYVRYGIVAYRDRGDSYVTKKYELTDNLNSVSANINELEANEGGDTPESVNEALHVAVNEMNWDHSRNTKKMIFLIGDAGPHYDYPNDYDYKKVALQAKNKGIKCFTVGCSGITSSGESEFKEIAKITGGTYDYLTYQQAYRDRRTGRTVHVLRAGEKKYVLEESAAKKEWKDGYKAMVTRKKAKMARDEDLSKMAPAPSAGKHALKNNLDQVLVQQVQMEAEKMGVKYKK